MCHTDIIWLSLAIASRPGTAPFVCSPEPVPASIPNPLAWFVLRSTVGDAGVDSGSLGSFWGGFGLEGNLGAGADGTAGDPLC